MSLHYLQSQALPYRAGFYGGGELLFRGSISSGEQGFQGMKIPSLDPLPHGGDDGELEDRGFGVLGDLFHLLLGEGEDGEDRIIHLPPFISPIDEHGNEFPRPSVRVPAHPFLEGLEVLKAWMVVHCSIIVLSRKSGFSWVAGFPSQYLRE